MDRAHRLPLRKLSTEYPNWRCVHTRWRRWVQRRLWNQVLAWVAADHDREASAVDATYVRVHAMAPAPGAATPRKPAADPGSA